jgi:hypothetical protein
MWDWAGGGMRYGEARKIVMRMLERMKPKEERIEAPSYEEELAWFKKQLDMYGREIYISACEADYRLFEPFEEIIKDLEFGFNPRDISVLAGPILLIPEGGRKELQQYRRAELHPLVRLAKDSHIKLYASRYRCPARFTVVRNLENALMYDEAGLGELPKNALLTENYLLSVGFGSYLSHSRKYYSDDTHSYFEREFVFLTDSELELFKRWAEKKRIDLKRYSQDHAFEFWKEYESFMKEKEMEEKKKMDSW